MSLSEVSRAHLEMAMGEATELGRRAFLEKYRFRAATTYLVRSSGRFFDPKAIMAVAHGHVEGRDPLAASDFDATEAVQRLTRLGYQIVEFSGLWWVNQGTTYAAERRGGFVWAPQTNSVGQPVHHHVAVNKLRVGQKLVHCANGYVRAIGTVAAEPTDRPKPAELGGQWGDSGYFCRVAYRDLNPPIPKSSLPNRTPAVGPFDVNGNLKQAYLTKVDDLELFPLLEYLVDQVPDFFEPISEDEAMAISDLPTGQDATPLIASPLLHLLRSSKNVVLEGVPGTGKTYAIEGLAAEWRAATGRDLVRFGGQPFATTVMHPSTAYEDFMEGLRPALSTDAAGSPAIRYFDERVAGDGKFQLDDGFFLRVCKEAVRHPDQDVLVLLDELNRCNVSSVLGDLLLSLEASKRARYMSTAHRKSATASDWAVPVHVTLPYSRRQFFVPDNVYVVATTNTTDRSVAPLDAAVRRRFSFVRLEPQFDGVRALANELDASARSALLSSATMLESLNNTVLGPCVGPDALLGQSYLHALCARLASNGTGDEIESVVHAAWRYQVVPQMIDGLRAHAAEDLLSTGSRSAWLTDHHADGAIGSIEEALGDLDSFLGRLGLEILVDGTGLTRGARLVDMPAGNRPGPEVSDPADGPVMEAQVDSALAASDTGPAA